MNGSNTNKQRLGESAPTETRTPVTASNGALSYDSETLFKGRVEIAIHHDGSVYRMRITRQGKLILNK